MTPVTNQPFTPVGRRVIKQDMVTQLLRAIFTGRFTGGDRLVENELALEFEVSRTPVREALNHLASTGLIEMQPNRGAVVRPFGPNQLRDIYDLRQLLESHATRIAHAKADRSALELLREQTAQLLSKRSRDANWSRRAMEVDEDLHELIARASGNERLYSEIIRYRKLVRVIRLAIANGKNYQVSALNDHIKILDALLDGTAGTAAQAMHDHIGNAMEAATSTVFAPNKQALLQGED